tara:strand:- start:22223 stop:23599 length:1377 start_codon:yes stop_codon:yes gene_type:complete
MEPSFSVPVFSNKTRGAKKKIAVFLSEMLENISKGNIHQSYESRFIPLSLSESLRLVTNHSFSEQEENLILQILRNAAVRCERKHATAGILFLFLVSSSLLELCRRPQDINNIVSEIEGLLKKIHASILPANKDDLCHYYDMLFRDNEISHILESAISLAGANGNIFIDKKNSKESSIELVCGYSYYLPPPQEFRLMTKLKSITLHDVKPIIIDGIIEKVSEVNLLLEKFHEEKQAGIIFARGYGEEVLATLATNWMRKTLEVIPVSVPYDLEGANLLKDIAVICGTDVVSSLKGELISSITFEDILDIPKVTLDNGHVVIENDNTSRSVSLHVRNIKEDIEACESIEKREFLSRRLNGLVSRCVHIKLRDSLMEKKGIDLDRLETGIKLTRDLSRFGLVDIKKIPLDVRWLYLSLIKLEKYGFDSLSFIAMCEALKSCISITRTLGNCSTMILCENK